MINSKTQNNCYLTPNKTFLIIFWVFSLIGFFLCLTSMTNFFTESPFKTNYLMIWFLIASGLFSTIKLNASYFRNTKNQ